MGVAAEAAAGVMGKTTSLREVTGEETTIWTMMGVADPSLFNLGLAS